MFEQPETALCIVGDRFAGFAAQEQVRTLRAFTKAVRDGEYDDLAHPLVILAGQGIGEYEWEYVHAVLRARGVWERVLFQDRVPDIVGRGEAHKCRVENVLVADLVRVDEDEYRASLRLHADNELLLDHQTGQHVQGMVAVEAVRQMFLAVTERYHASSHPHRYYYFVIDSLATTFENFLFPLDASIHYRVHRSDLEDPGRLGFGVTVDIEQGGRRSSRSEVEFTAFASETLHEIEHRRAGRALHHYLADSGRGDWDVYAEPAGLVEAKG
ncbi:AfsA-related hotdog domain-containing protein [Nocardiopsis sp. NPDC055551]